MESSVTTPITNRERVQTIDIIRAFALFGVVVVNLTVDNRGISPDEGRTDFFDQLAYWPIRFFLDDKAMATYCFLFGLGFSIQLLRAQERNAPFLFMFIRRFVSLFIIGIIALILTDETIPHEYAMVGVFLLLFYKVPKKFLPGLALACILLPFARDVIVNQQDEAGRQQTEANVKNTRLIKVDSNLLNSYTGVYRMTPALVMVITKKGNALVAEGPGRTLNLVAKSDSEFIRADGGVFKFGKDLKGNVSKLTISALDGHIYYVWPKIQADLQQALKTQLRKRVVFSGAPGYSYKEYLKNSATKVWDRFSHWSWHDFYWGGDQVSFDIQYIFSYFLIGLYAGHRRIFYDIASNSDFLKKAMWWGFAIGVTGMSVQLGFEVWNLTYGLHWDHYSPITRLSEEFCWSTGVMAMTFAYVAGLTLLLERSAWKQRLSFLAPVGRMGFTNYLLQAALYVCILPCGFRPLGANGLFYMMLISLPVYSLLILLSHWWLKRFAMGPVEWLWRSLTYWKLQPMRLRQ